MSRRNKESASKSITSFLKSTFRIEENPKKGFLALEWVMLAYLVFTLLLVLFTYTKVVNPESMIWGRLRVVVLTIAMWAVYRMIPCRFTMLARVIVQVILLGWWYPDTYEINRMLPNLDHLFAQAEQDIFGCQPALLWHQLWPSAVVSELMGLGYVSYYPMIVLCILYYFVYQYEEFGRASFIVMTSFFLYYLIFIFLPVTGPQFYYPAVGAEDIANGIFPNLYDYFNTHQEALVTPGWKDGFFYHMVEEAKVAGERPTAAFPSSHVGIATVIMLLFFHDRAKKLFLAFLPLYIFLCLATVYIEAHYLIDAIAGLISGVIFYFVLLFVTKKLKI